MIDLTISIVNTNNRDMLDACLASIYENTQRITFEIIVVDNASADGSADMAAQKYPDVQLIKNTERKGFSANHNQALARMRGRFCAILNEDTLVKPGCFDMLVAYLSDHPDAGALGPRILNSDGSLQQSVFRMPTLSVLVSHAFFLGALFPGVIYFGGYRKWPHNALSDVPFLSGACIVFPSDLMRAVGYMDAEFFIYFEDPDICKRVREAGRRVVFFPDAEIVHYGGGTFNSATDAAINHRMASLHRFFRKHYGPVSEVAAGVLLQIGAAARVAAFGAARRLGPASRRQEFAAKQEYFQRILKWYRRRGVT